MKPTRAPSRKMFALLVVAATILYAAALIANVIIGAVVGIIIGMFISLAVCSIHRIWHRNVLLLLAIGSWALTTLLVDAHCLAASSAVCALNPLRVSWLPSLFYALCWLAWTTSAAADARKEQ